MVEPPTVPPAPTIAVVRWPSDAAARAAAHEAGRPCLLLVEPGERPPQEWTDLEDWMRLPADPHELAARRSALALRASHRQPPFLDEDGLLRRADRWVALPDSELGMLRVLLERAGALVDRRAVHDAARPFLQPSDGDRGFDHAVQRLRRRVRPFGVVIHTVRNAGYLLEIGDVP